MKVEIKTPSRLHFGLIDLSNSHNRRFGSIGATIDKGYKIQITDNSDKLKVNSDNNKNINNVKEVVNKFSEEYGIHKNLNIDIIETLPRHVGLSSTTQLNLGTAIALKNLFKINKDYLDFAKLLERGNYTSIGTYGFKKGGFILDGGIDINKTNKMPPMILREKIPKKWSFIVVIPKGKGYDEKEESPILKNHIVNKKIPEKISHNILMKLLPAIKEKKISKFGESVNEIQELVGRSFSKYQDGKFHKSSKKIVQYLSDNTYGAGQSSWGPGVYGITNEDRETKTLKSTEEYLEEENIKAKTFIAKPNNKGYTIKLIEE